MAESCCLISVCAFRMAYLTCSNVVSLHKIIVVHTKMPSYPPCAIRFMLMYLDCKTQKGTAYENIHTSVGPH